VSARLFLTVCVFELQFMPSFGLAAADELHRKLEKCVVVLCATPWVLNT